MKPGQTEYLGDGAYLHFDGYGFELRANHHETPTDRVYLEPRTLATMSRLIKETVGEETPAPPAPPPISYQSTTPRDVLLQDAANAVKQVMPPGECFFILSVPSGNPENQGDFISNMPRENSIAVIKEFLIRNGHEEDWIKNTN